jgi:hypothetical protein
MQQNIGTAQVGNIDEFINQLSQTGFQNYNNTGQKLNLTNQARNNDKTSHQNTDSIGGNYIGK